MPFRQRAFSRRRGMNIRPVDSMKNVRDEQAGLTTTLTQFTLANSVDSAALTASADVERGCTINLIYLIINIEGTGGTGVTNVIDFYLWKNPGTNLTAPGPQSVGSSNEKKFVFKQWRILAPRIQDGSPAYHWEGWIKIPKQYRRMGSDDRLELVAVANVTANWCYKAIYKWYK